MVDSPLFDMQAPKGVPLSSAVETVTDPLLPPQSLRAMLGHLPEEIYDLRPESHVSRLMGVLLGDTGTGQLRKQYTYSHISQVLASAHFYDLDRFFGDVFGLKRLLTEGLPFNPYEETGTAEEWEAAMAADGSYRNRVALFVRGINMGATPSGLTMMASAVVGHPVRLYESYQFLDEEQTYTGADGNLTYGDMEAFTFGELEEKTFGMLDGMPDYIGRGSRTEFIVRPLRPISQEERYHLIRVLNRMKPVGSMMTIDMVGTRPDQPVIPGGIHSPSEYWSVRSKVSADVTYAEVYPRYDDGRPVEQPRPAFSEYQGEEWFYNGDTLGVTAYAVDGETTIGQNYERVIDQNSMLAADFLPEYALVPQIEILRGRSVQDGVLVTTTLGGRSG